MPGICCVKDCRHRCGPQDGGHQLPSDVNKRNKWLAVFAFNQIEVDIRPKKPVVCQCHFTENQFSLNEKRKCLKADAIPTLFGLSSVFDSVEETLKMKECEELIQLKNIKREYECLTSGLLKFMTENQILHIINGDPDLEFDNQTIIKSLEILQKSNQRTYEFIYSLGYPLPSYKTLQKKIKTLSLESEESQQLIANKEDLIGDKSQSHKRVPKKLITIKPNLIIRNKNSDNNNPNIKVSKVIKIIIEKQNENNSANNNSNNNKVIFYNIENPKMNSSYSKCIECNLDFDSKQKYRLHKTVYHSPVSYKFICDTNGCGFSTNYKPSLEEHKKLHKKGSKYVKQKVIKTIANHVNEGQSESVSDNSENNNSQTNNKRLETTIEKVFEESEDNKDYSVESNSKLKSVETFDCAFPNCNSKYEDLDQLKEHISGSHLIYQYFNCFECDLRFESETQLKKHNNEWHFVTISENKDLIENKSQTEKSKTQLKCKFANCSRVFRSKLRLISHLLKFHSQKRLKCNLCGFETKLISHLKRHRNKEHFKQINNKILNINHFVCKVCKETFYSENGLSKHRNLFHKELALHCNYCEFSAKNMDDFNKHKLIHINERKQYSCDECSQRFTSQRHLDSNKSNIHVLFTINKESLKCDLCEYKTKDHKFLEIHQRRHRGEDPFLCSIDGCDKSFKHMNTLEMHQNRDHYKDNPYKCDKCEEAFPGKLPLTRHKDKVHSERLFVCDLCDYKTIEKYSLFRHRLSHSNVKSLKCQINGCEKEFKHKQYLQNHQNRVHFKTFKKNFKCDWPECGLSFEARNKLKAHIFRHKNERPISCDWPECEARFADKSALSAHRKTHLKPYKCQSIRCNLKFGSKSEMLKHFKSKHK